MSGNKVHLVIFLLSLCWALSYGDKEIEYVTEDLEAATLSYDFVDKLDKLAESVEYLMSAFSKTQDELKHLRQKIDRSPQILSTTAGKNSNVTLNVLEVKCPNERLPESCFEVAECKSDLYSIMIPSYSNHSLAVSCDFKTNDGGWTVIQRRQDGSVDFNRNRTEYVKGFGDVNGEFFIGLEKLHILTSQEGKPQELYIILEDFEGVRRYAKYQTFKIDSSDTDYKLTVEKYSGNAGDNLTYHNGAKFSTWDHDFELNCVEKYKSGWWRKSCIASSLNGKYLMGKLSKSQSGQGIVWGMFRGLEYSLKSVQMMIRPRKN